MDQMVEWAHRVTKVTQDLQGSAVKWVIQAHPENLASQDLLEIMEMMEKMDSLVLKGLQDLKERLVLMVILGMMVPKETPVGRARLVFQDQEDLLDFQETVAKMELREELDNLVLMANKDPLVKLGHQECLDLKVSLEILVRKDSVEVEDHQDPRVTREPQACQVQQAHRDLMV